MNGDCTDYAGFMFHAPATERELDSQLLAIYDRITELTKSLFRIRRRAAHVHDAKARG